MTRRIPHGVLIATALCAVQASAQQGRPQQIPGNAQRFPVATHEDLQPPQLPALPAGLTLAMIARGDSIYHGKGNCFACHGEEAEGMPAAGDALTVSLAWAQYSWTSIDSLIDHGIPQALTRSPMQMPPRGGRSDLTRDEVRLVAAYVWAISQTRGEPWPGGHAVHTSLRGAAAATNTSIRTRADSAIWRRPPR